MKIRPLAVTLTLAGSLTANAAGQAGSPPGTAPAGAQQAAWEKYMEEARRDHDHRQP
jgi:hypothetical protein